jgi:type IV secretory pathway TrbD component
MSSDRPREIYINQALCRPDHLWGAERELVLSAALIAITLICLAFKFWITIFALSFWVLVFTGLKMMAKADPIMSRIYLRHIRYRPYYPAHSTPSADTKKSFRGW